MNAKQATEALRREGWSDAAIANAIGCSQPTITRIRNGRSDPRESLSREIQKLLAKNSADRANDPPLTPDQNRENRHASRPQNPTQS